MIRSSCVQKQWDDLDGGAKFLAGEINKLAEIIEVIFCEYDTVVAISVDVKPCTKIGQVDHVALQGHIALLFQPGFIIQVDHQWYNRPSAQTVDIHAMLQHRGGGLHLEAGIRYVGNTAIIIHFPKLLATATQAAACGQCFDGDNAQATTQHNRIQFHITVQLGQIHFNKIGINVLPLDLLQLVDQGVSILLRRSINMGDLIKVIILPQFFFALAVSDKILYDHSYNYTDKANGSNYAENNYKW